MVSPRENLVRGQKLRLSQGLSIYSKEMIHEICQRFENGETAIAITKEYNDGEIKASFYNFVRGVRNGKNWTDISSQYDFSKAVDEKEYGWDETIAEFVDMGYSKNAIYEALEIDPNDEYQKNRIKRMIRRYKDFKKLNVTTPVVVDAE